MRSLALMALRALPGGPAVAADHCSVSMTKGRGIARLKTGLTGKGGPIATVKTGFARCDADGKGDAGKRRKGFFDPASDLTSDLTSFAAVGSDE